VHAPPAGELLGAWGDDAGVLALLLAVTFWYAVGARKWAAARRGHDLAFAAAMFTLFAALASPIDAVAPYLLWVHMLQHVLLAQVAAPLLVIAAPVATFERALPRRWRRRSARVAARLRTTIVPRLLANPLLAFLAVAAAWWGWHAPALYDAAVRHSVVHAAEHLTLLGTGIWWWNCVLGRHHIPAAQGIALTAATGIHLNVLGALITFAPHPLYAAYSGAYGLSALEDQQLGGVLMWIVGGFVSLGFLVVFVHELLREEEAKAPTASALA
jgi:putative membrane protein